MSGELDDVAAGGFGELRSGRLGVRLATSPGEVEAALALRYRVFYEEGGARADGAASGSQQDRDRFDAVAEHLLVVDHGEDGRAERVVATYRLIRAAAAARVGGFYSAAEYDLSPVLAFPGAVMELGRSCVHPDYRSRPAMQLLWRGIAATVFHYRIGLMFGCASLPGTDPDHVAAELTYLHTYHLAPPALRLRALPDRYVEMRRCDPATLEPRRLLAQLPPLIKGYLRLGGFVGDGAVVDREFNTTDIAVVVQTDLVTDKYYRHYEREARDGSR
jgi:putative hemolysin